MGIRILLIADEADIADFLVRGLREEGFTVEHAADGTDGWHQLQGGPWDVVLLDWRLPGQAGLALLRRFRERDVLTPVLFLTARDAISDRVRGLDNGADDFDLLVIPGGYAPDHMRRCDAMIRLVSTMAEQGKPVAAICHGPWMLCSTQALKGRKATCFFAIKDDVINAGGKYVDQEVVRDGNIITSRKPDDLPAFMQTLIQAVRELKPAMAGAR